MEDVFISFETAKSLKQLNIKNILTDKFYVKPRCKLFGIDEKGRYFPSVNRFKTLYKVGEHAVLYDKNVYIAPTQSLLQKYLREIHDIHIQIHTFTNQPVGEEIWENCYQAFVDFNGLHPYYKTYEEALEVSLQESLNLIKRVLI